jgi:hypothetical protein
LNLRVPSFDWYFETQLGDEEFTSGCLHHFLVHCWGFTTETIPSLIMLPCQSPFPDNDDQFVGYRSSKRTRPHCDSQMHSSPYVILMTIYSSASSN